MPEVGTASTGGNGAASASFTLAKGGGQEFSTVPRQFKATLRASVALSGHSRAENPALPLCAIPTSQNAFVKAGLYSLFVPVVELWGAWFIVCSSGEFCCVDASAIKWQVL